MVELIQANWLVLVIALLIGVVVAWSVFVGSRRTRVEIEPREEAEDKAPARRNQALIDAAPAAAGREPGADAAARDMERAERIMPPGAPQGLAGAGEAVQMAAAPEAVPDTEAAEPPPAPAAAAEIEPDVDQPAPTPASPAGEAPAAGDELTRIKGLGPKIAVQLNEMGVSRFAQIAAWDEAEIDRIDAQLGRFQGRIRRDQWPEQARLLAAGDTPGYEERFGKL